MGSLARRMQRHKSRTCTHQRADGSPAMVKAYGGDLGNPKELGFYVCERCMARFDYVGDPAKIAALESSSATSAAEGNP